jgi:hypothetical protein
LLVWWQKLTHWTIASEWCFLLHSNIGLFLYSLQLLIPTSQSFAIAVCIVGSLWQYSIACSQFTSLCLFEKRYIHLVIHGGKVGLTSADLHFLYITFIMRSLFEAQRKFPCKKHFITSKETEAWWNSHPCLTISRKQLPFDFNSTWEI